MALFRATPIKVIWETKPDQPSVMEAILEVQFTNGDHQYLTVQVLRVSERVPAPVAASMYVDPEEEKKPTPISTPRGVTGRPPGFK